MSRYDGKLVVREKSIAILAIVCRGEDSPARIVGAFGIRLPWYACPKAYQAGVAGQGRKGKMAKRKARPTRQRPPTLKQIQELQAKVLEAQEALEQETVSVSAGGGAIKVVMSGHQKIKSIEIEPAVLEDVEMLQDLVIAAINEAIERSQQLAADKMSAFTGGLQGLI